jgi:hypothetical protein
LEVDIPQIQVNPIHNELNGDTKQLNIYLLYNSKKSFRSERFLKFVQSIVEYKTKNLLLLLGNRFEVGYRPQQPKQAIIAFAKQLFPYH